MILHRNEFGDEITPVAERYQIGYPSSDFIIMYNGKYLRTQTGLNKAKSVINSLRGTKTKWTKHEEA